MHAGSAASVWGGGETEEQEAGVEGEGGGEDEGGEGDAVGHQDQGEESPTAWSDIAKLNLSFTHTHLFKSIIQCLTDHMIIRSIL